MVLVNSLSKYSLSSNCCSVIVSTSLISKIKSGASANFANSPLISNIVFCKEEQGVCSSF